MDQVAFKVVDHRRSENAQCTVVPGFGMLLGLGARAAVSDHLTLGLRASARNPGTGTSCTMMAGPASFDTRPALFAFSSTFDYRW